MFRLFISLFCMVLFSFVIFIASGAALESFGSRIGANANIEERISRGTFDLLDESINNLNSEERNVLIKKYQTVFGPVFNLLELSTLGLNTEQNNIIENNDVLMIDDVKPEDILDLDREESQILIDTDLDDDEEETTIDLLFRKHLDTSLVWRIHLDTDVDVSLDNLTSSITVDGGRYVDGMFYVLEQKLSNIDIPSLKDNMEKYVPNYSLTIKLLNKSEVAKALKEKPELQTRFQQQKVINITQNTKDTTFIHAFSNDSHALQIGPIEIPWFVRNFLLFMILLLVFSIATALSIWLWPLWSNLLKIKKAANDFGKGNYSTRVSYRKSSATASISQAFNNMAERTQQSISTQKELTNAVSHELRTPVARMRFALEMLEESDSDSDKSRYMESLNDDIDDLDSLLEELLSYARFDQNNTTPEMRLVKLTPWLSSAMDKLMPLAEDKLLNYQIIRIGINESAYLEPRLMSRVLDNLVQNALRYSNNVVEILLSKDTKHYLITVEDDGDGISKADQAHVFDAFSRIDSSRDRSTGGFGLGLAIAERIIKAHQGTITIKDSKLGGACFEVCWPIKIES